MADIENTKNVRIHWEHPRDANGDIYDKLAGYEIHHNIPGFASPHICDPSVNSSDNIPLPEGIYSVGIAAINTDGHKSKKVIHNFQVANTIQSPEVSRDYGVPLGGTMSTNSYITTAGIFKTESGTGWSFASAGSPRNYSSFQNGHADRYSQDCSDIASLDFSSMTDNEAAIKSHYIFFDASDSNNPLKLIKYEDLVHSTSNNLNVGYFYDSGTGNTTAESTFVTKTGTVSVAAGSNDVVGTSTLFTTEYAIDDIIYFSSARAAKITFINSNTSLTIDTTTNTAITNSAIKVQGFTPDKNLDAAIWQVRKDSGTFKIAPINLTIDESVFNRSRVATLQAAPNLLNFDSTPTLTTSYTNLILTATGNGFLSPKFKITGTGFNNSEISQTADSSFQNPTSGKTYVKTLDKVDAFVTTDLDFTITVTEAADEDNTDLQSTQDVTIPFIKDGSGSGSTGNDAKIVQLTVDDYSIIYAADGSTPSPSGNMTLTATSQNFTNPYFKFTGDGIADETIFTDGTDDSDTFTFAIPTNHFSDPKSLRVGVAESAADTTEIAFDSISITAVKPGATGARGVDGMTFVITNEAHVFSASTAGAVSSYTGSGTIIEVYEGGTELVYDGTGTSNSRWKTTEAATNITVGTKTDSGDYLTVENHSGVANGTDESKIIYTITGKRADGTSFTAQAQQSFTKSKKGTDGSGGKKSLSGLLYYVANSGLSSSAPSAPSGTATYTFSTGAFSNLDNAWSYNPPTYAAGNSNKYWYQYFKVEEATAGGGTGSVSLIGSVTQGFGFSGVVTFTGSGQLTDGSSTSGFGTSNFDGAYNTLTGKPNLFDGAYGSLSGAPTIPTAVSQLSNDSNFLGSGANISVLNNDTGFVVPTGVAQAINNNTTTIDGGKITTNTVNANRLQSNSVLSNVIYVGNALITNTSGKIYSAGKADFGNTTAGFFLGYSSGHYKFDIGNNSQYLRWTGSGLEVKGDMSILNPEDILISSINNDDNLTDDTTAVAAQSTATTANSNAVNALTIANTKTTAAAAAAAANLATKAAGSVGGWTITSSYIQGGTNVYVASGKTSYGSGTGFWLGNDGTTPKFDIGSSSGYLRWDGSALNIKGNITLDNASSINISGFNNNSNFTNDTAADAAQVTANSKTTLAAANTAVNANVTSISGGVIQTGTLVANKIESGNNTIGSSSDKFAFAGSTEYSGFTTVIGATAITSSRFAGLYFGSGSYVLGAQSASSLAAGLFVNSASLGATSSNTQSINASSTIAGQFIHTSSGNKTVMGTSTHAAVHTGTVSPFTGSHDGLLADSETCEVGDILVDTGVAHAKSVSDVITNVTRSTSTNQKSVLGVFVQETPDHIPPSLAKVDNSGLTPTETIDSDHNSIVANKTIVTINSIGEGQVNVCGENGDIEIGDLIVSSSTTGKGMKQDDDIVRSCTVGKSREAVTFASASTVKQIACIYMCG